VFAVFGKILSDTGAFDQDCVIEGLGSEWLIAQSYFKLHPAGRYAHSAIDALEDLLATVPGGRLDPAAVERIEVRAYMLAAMLGEKRVTSSFGARFSVPFALASILFHGRSGLVAFDDAAVTNPVVQALAQRVDLREDTAFTARYPAEQPVEIRIVMSDGTAHSGHCVITKGEPAKPHRPEELTAKFFELGDPIWGRAITQTLYDGLMNIEAIDKFAAFSETLSL
jgi:2-methylcitrate dehydratase PrpD